MAYIKKEYGGGGGGGFSKLFQFFKKKISHLGVSGACGLSRDYLEIPSPLKQQMKGIPP